MSEPVGSKRNFALWRRLLGHQEQTPPAHQLVTLVGDERELREKWIGPRGLAGGLASGNVDNVRVQIVAPDSGCSVRWRLHTDAAGAPEEIFVFAAAPPNPAGALGFHRIVGSEEQRTVNAMTNRPCRTIVWTDEVLGGPGAAGMVIDAINGAPDCWTSRYSLPMGHDVREDDGTWWDLDAGVVLNIVVATLALTFALQIKEPSVPPLG